MKNSWAAANLSGSGDLFEVLHSGLKVDLIATPRSDLKTCRLSEDVSAVLQRNTNLYDYIPVVDDIVDGSSHIAGLFHVASHLRDKAVEGRIHDHFARV